VVHVTGRLVFVSASDAGVAAAFKRYARLTGGHQHCAEVLEGVVADDVVHGMRNIYRTFADVVDYAEPYRGLQRLVGRGNESAGRVVKEYAAKTWLDTHLSDCFSQVGGIWVNCMTDCSPDDMYIATGFEKWLRSPVMGPNYVRPGTWDVLAVHQRENDKLFLSDIFVFDAVNGNLVEAILGINYHGISKLSMSKTLARLTPGLSDKAPASTSTTAVLHSGTESNSAREPGADPALPVPGGRHPSKPKATSPQSDVAHKIRLILADISGLEPVGIKDAAGLADIGIDSLMGMELGREMEGVFKTPLMSDQLAQVTTFKELVAHVSGVLGVPVGDDDLVDSASDDNTGSDSPSSTPMTSASTPPLDKAEERLKADLALAHASNMFGGAGELLLPPEAIFGAFEEVKRLTDKFVADYRCADYMDTVQPKQTRLCVALAVEAFERLGVSLASARAGAMLPRIQHQPEHGRLVEWLYWMLEHEARLVNVSADTGAIVRTGVAVPAISSDAILAELLAAYPDHEWANRLTYFAGRRLVEVLRGEQDGIKLIFGTDEGRELVTGLYGDSLLNKLANAQMQHVLERLVGNLSKPLQGPLKIMELGAGTGGTTKGLVPLLDRLGVPVEYTFTDLSASFVAAARKKFGKQYPFMKFRVHDIEKEPAAELLGTQHVVIASNAVHATRSIATSVTNIRKALRPDGFLMLLEMTEPLCWVDMIFGLFEGWWLFDDGRRHAIAHQSRWKAELEAAGYGRIDGTDGWRPETEIQRVIVAKASAQPGLSTQPTPMQFEAPAPVRESLTDTQKAQLDAYVRTYTQDFDVTSGTAGTTVSGDDDGVCVAVTGATGSLGAHLVAHLASLPTVKTVYCLNRRSTPAEPTARQIEAFASRGIQISPEAIAAKLRVLVVESAKPMLGLDTNTYRAMAQSVTHIVHNAWPMTGKRPVSGLEGQFRVMRNLIDLARDAAACRGGDTTTPITFQLVSSIAVMGHYSLLPGHGRFAPETRAEADHLLPNGYAQAKWVCERMLDATLHGHPARFRAMVVRPGQIAGSEASGYWNPLEHLSFLFKSSQTLGALPALRGDVCWTPVDRVAGTMADLLLLDAAVRVHAVYHIDNPVRQPWEELLPVVARELGVPARSVVGFAQWVRRVRRFPGAVDDNPAARLVDFLADNFVRMSCGGLLLETRNTCMHSPTLSAVGPVSEELVKKYVDWWKGAGFLQPVVGNNMA
jgi:thioester reductase-like protein/SAM-dependent methyltransferase/acyl carrier protein